MNPKTKKQFIAACEHAQELALSNAIITGEKSTWLVEYKGKQYFFTAERL